MSLRWLLVLARKGSIEIEVKQILDANVEAKRITEEADVKAKEVVATAEAALPKRGKVTRAEERVFKREETLDKKQAELDSEIEAVKGKDRGGRTIKERAEALAGASAQDELAKVAGLTKDEAKSSLCRARARGRRGPYDARGQARARRARAARAPRREILTTAIHRLGNSVASDTMATAITIPNDELKGKIIGKEGRNIKAFERATGVEVIIDDTPGSIVLSPTTRCAAPLRAWRWRI
jgi:ribonuclease Y